MTKIFDIGHELHEAEHRLLVELRLLRRSLRKHPVWKENSGRVGNYYLPACRRAVL